ncbi:SH3 domain-containing protein [Flavonifractor sp. An100]|uniref:SH3 domain-containing protein n=1 Tax=Flavonifractor sp. An100 TaxID=1965538 RepID=UPI001302B84D|nr:SH3 domain-containing protein [Flavonifractor sp. An100]
MAERKTPSRRTQDRRSAPERQAPSRRASSEKQTPPRRNDVIRCENCGEDYSITYKRCPFCDERPGRGISGRRVAEGGYGAPVHPVQVVGLVISLVLIIAALFIVIKYVGPLIFGNNSASSAGSSVSTSQTDASGADQSQPDSSSSVSSGSQTGEGSSASGSSSQTEQPQVTVNSISLNRTDITLPANEPYQFTATVDPAGTEVTWSSSDSSVLTVDEDGIVKNVNTSSELKKVTITATAGDKSAECVVYCKGSGTSDSGSSSTGSGSGSTTGNTTSGPVAANTPGTIVNAGNGLNVRSGPGSTYDKVASIKNGDQIIILEDTGSGWYKIDYGAGGVGYVSSDYVSVG